MPTLLLGNKIRQYRQLAVLQQCRLNRNNDPFSAYQREHHRAALQLVSDILKQEWSFLLLERRFLQDSRTFTLYLIQVQVVDKLLEALEAYERCLTHQALDPSRVRYDLTEFEGNLGEAITTIITVGQDVLYEAVERPKTSWKCTKEYEGWKGSWRELVDPLKGKLRVSERDFPELGRLIDGNITVTFCDEDGEGVDELPLSATLPEELVGTFNEACKQAGSLDLKMRSKVSEVRPAGSLKIPQGRKEFTFRPKIVKKIAAIKTEEETDTGVPAVVETRPSIRLTLRRKQTQLAS
jgi:DNA-binding HxlR family transcriptional regulator